MLLNQLYLMHSQIQARLKPPTSLLYDWPNMGLVPVPDERLDKLVDISSLKKFIPLFLLLI